MMKPTSKRASRLLRWVPVVALPLGVAACDVDSLLDVDDPDVATPGSLSDSTAFPVLFAGAIADFALAYGGSGATGGGGSNEGVILLSGMLADEFKSMDTFDTRIRIDRRAIEDPEGDGASSNGQLEDAERNLHRARRAAETAVETFAALGAPTDVRRAELLAIAGYTYVLFGENYCSGVPFSEFPRGGGDPVYGAPTPTAEIFNRAIARFDSALAIAPTGLVANLARVGKGRAQVNLNQYAAAATTVAPVPDNFYYQIFYSDNTAGQENGVWHYGRDNERYGVPERDGGNGLPWVSAEDPRAPSEVSESPPFATSIDEDLIIQAKYPERGSEIPLATGIEARLIEAEAAYARGANTDHLPFVNRARAAFNARLRLANPQADTVALLTPADIPATPAARVDQLFAERGFSLWLTAHRLGDLRRLVRQYGRAVNTVYPSGAYFRGGTYGTDVVLPLFIDELNNPSFTGCIDRNA